MEFLMTYGWAILVVLVVIGALAYFGVLSPATLLPEKCSFPVSVNCVDHAVEDLKITVILLNGAGRDMNIQDIDVSSDALGGVLVANRGRESCSTTGPNLPGPIIVELNSVLRNSQRGTFIMEIPDPAVDSADCTFRDTGRDKNRYNITVRYNWLDSKTLTHYLVGELLAKAP